MKQIKLNAVRATPRGTYTVFVRPGLRYEFPSRREAERFQPSLSAYLEEHLGVANELLADLYARGRQLYPLLTPRESRAHKESVRRVEDALDGAYRVAPHRENGPAFAYSKTSYCFDEIDAALAALEGVCVRRKYYFAVRGLRARRRGVATTWDEFERFDLRRDEMRRREDRHRGNLRIV